MEFPEIVRIRQTLNLDRLDDPRAVADAEMAKLLDKRPVKAGETVAITAGSRGIADVKTVIEAAIAALKKVGAKPCIIPSMGSHGGSTAEGQASVLEHMGITEESMGVPVVSSMETEMVGETGDKIPVYVDKNACHCDHILAVNRVKPHTEFSGKVQSGLTKMLVIGLGKQHGAEVAHLYAVRYGYEHTLLTIGDTILKNTPVMGGIGIVENGVGQTCAIEAVTPENWFEEESALLGVASKTCPKLPFNPLDVLVIDESGKNISGTGMDTKVVGRIMNIYEPPLTKPKITRIVLRDLAKPNDGNALGMGLVDFITKKVADQINPGSTKINCVTAVTPEKGRMPIVCDDDRDALHCALATAGPISKEEIRLAWIRNTSTLEEMWVSTALAEAARDMDNIEILGDPVPMCFDESGNLTAGC